jgi:hypothetical protein
MPFRITELLGSILTCDELAIDRRVVARCGLIWIMRRVLMKGTAGMTASASGKNHPKVGRFLKWLAQQCWRASENAVF